MPADEGTPRVEVLTFVQGPAMTNAYLVADPEACLAAVIDPAWDGLEIARAAEARRWRITAIWLTHAHFDHFAGSAALAEALPVPVPVGLNPADHALWRSGGLAGSFGLGTIDPGPEPTVPLEHGAVVRVGTTELEVRHCPGHTPGHVLLLGRAAGFAFVGDLIFQGSIGRSDLPGGDMDTLMKSIRDEILTLPDEVRLFPGHGAETTVGEERRGNPFLGATAL